MAKQKGGRREIPAPTERQIQMLADGFHRRMREVIGLDACRAVDEENRRRSDNTCASHDHVDANEVMLAAFEDVFRRSAAEEPMLEGPDVDAWNRAWTAAKEAGFAPAE